MKQINQFRGENAFLSNFYPCRIVCYGMEFKSAEAAFQAAKCRRVKDRVQFQTFDPRQAKREGRIIEIRKDWEIKKVEIMRAVLKAKFLQNMELAERLTSTGDTTLIEGNSWHDNYWGSCYCPKCKDKLHHNIVGKLLMELRQEIENYERIETYK